MSASRRTPISQEELRARALELGHVPAAAGKGLDTGLLVLKLGREWYGVPAPLVREVALDPALATLPLTPPFVAGIMNLRGELVGAIDLAALLNLPGAGGSRPYAVVTRLDGTTVAFLAEEVSGVEWFALPELEHVIPTLPEEYARFFAGAFRSGDRLITELNIEGILNHPQLLGLSGGGDAAAEGA